MIVLGGVTNGAVGGSQTKKWVVKDSTGTAYYIPLHTA
jgi:hypothetical protein